MIEQIGNGSWEDESWVVRNEILALKEKVDLSLKHSLVVSETVKDSNRGSLAIADQTKKISDKVNSVEETALLGGFSEGAKVSGELLIALNKKFKDQQGQINGLLELINLIGGVAED